MNGRSVKMKFQMYSYIWFSRRFTLLLDSTFNFRLNIRMLFLSNKYDSNLRDADGSKQINCMRMILLNATSRLTYIFWQPNMTHTWHIIRQKGFKSSIVNGKIVNMIKRKCQWNSWNRIPKPKKHFYRHFVSLN